MAFRTTALGDFKIWGKLLSTFKFEVCVFGVLSNRIDVIYRFHLYDKFCLAIFLVFISPEVSQSNFIAPDFMASLERHLGWNEAKILILAD